MGDIPVYVISLADAHVRRANVKARLRVLGIPFQFVDAIDGRAQRLPDLFDGARVVRDGFWSESALACAMSHRKVHRTIIDAGHEQALILEDDAEPCEDFASALSDAVSSKGDIIKLEGEHFGQKRATIKRIGPRFLTVCAFVSAGSAAYLIRRSAAERFCALPILDLAIDLQFSDARLGLRVFELEPFPVVQDRQTESACGYQRYANPPRSHSTGRPSILERLRGSIRKRIRVVQTYGPRIALRLELARLRATP
jgi:GR25 family glycosyltransferase involved in LPS biosynthesis